MRVAGMVRIASNAMDMNAAKMYGKLVSLGGGLWWLRGIE